MKERKNVLWIALLVISMFMLVNTGCVWKIGERSPVPAVNVVGENLKIAMDISNKVPDEFIIKKEKTEITEVHKTIRNAFMNAFEDYAVEKKKDSNLIIQISFLSVSNEYITNFGSTFRFKYKAVLKLTENGKVIRTAAGTAYPNNSLSGDWERKYDDGYEVMFEEIAKQLFLGGNFVLPEIQESESEEKEEQIKNNQKNI